jgi:CHAT domain-containing protein
MSEVTFGAPDWDRKWRQAEEALSRGALEQALDLYQEILLGHLPWPEELSPALCLTAERFADVAVLLGQFDGADLILEGLVRERLEPQPLRAGSGAPSGRATGGDPPVHRERAAIFLTLKRAHLAQQLGRLGIVEHLLRSLQPYTGSLHDLPTEPRDLPRWEAKCCWPQMRADDPIIFLCSFYLVAGLNLMARGFYRQAVTLLNRGAELAQPPAPPLAAAALVPLRLATAGACLEKGDLAPAAAILDSLEGKLDFRQAPGSAVHWLELTGQLHWLQGRLGPALAALEKVVQLCWDLGLWTAAMSASLNVGQILVLLNRLQDAEEHARLVAISALRLEDRNLALRAAWLLRLAQARLESPAGEDRVPLSVGLMWGKGTDASSDSGLEIVDPVHLPPAANFLAFFAERAQAVLFALATRTVAEAATRLRRVADCFAQADSLLIRLRLRALGAMVAYDQREYERAASLLQEILPQLEKLNLKPELWQDYRMLHWCSERIGWPAQERLRLREKAQTLLQELAGTLPPDQQAVFLLNKWTQEEEELNAAVQQLQQAKERMLRGSWFLRPWRLWRLWRQIHGFLHRLDGHRRLLTDRILTGQDAAAPSNLSMPSLWHRLWRHPRDRITISFLVLPDRVFVCRAGWFRLDFEVCPVTRPALRKAVAQWHARVQALKEAIAIVETARSKANHPNASVPRADVVGLDLATAEARAAAELEELEKRTAEVANQLRLPDLLANLRLRRLTIVPDDVLHGFPFAALRLHGEYLCQNWALTIAFDRFADYAPAAVQPVNEALTIAVSCGAAEGNGFAEIEELPETRPEVEHLNDWLRQRGVQPTCLVDRAAGRTAVLALLAKAHFMHIACHGYFDPARPQASGLVLLPAPNRMEVLTLGDFQEMQLNALRHVTLSNCWSADNFQLPGRWIISLPETLCRRGTASVLACLWPVHDKAGRQFSAAFYKHLATSPRDRALQEAQKELQQDEATRAPLFWAGYQLYGDPRPLPVGSAY